MSTAHQRYKEIAEVREGEVLCIVTQRIDSGHLSFRCFKTYFDRTSGENKRSSFLSAWHIPDMHKALDKAEALMEEQSEARRERRASRGYSVP